MSTVVNIFCFSDSLHYLFSDNILSLAKTKSHPVMFGRKLRPGLWDVYRKLKSIFFYDTFQGFVANGVHLLLSFPKVAGSRYTSSEFVDFSAEMGKVGL